MAGKRKGLKICKAACSASLGCMVKLCLLNPSPHGDVYTHRSISATMTPQQHQLVLDALYCPPSVDIALCGEWPASGRYKDERTPTHPVRFISASTGSPTGRKFHGDRTPIVVCARESLVHGKGAALAGGPELPRSGGSREGIAQFTRRRRYAQGKPPPPPRHSSMPADSARRQESEQESRAPLAPGSPDTLLAGLTPGRETWSSVVSVTPEARVPRMHATDADSRETTWTCRADWPRMRYWRAVCGESRTYGSEGGGRKRAAGRRGTSSAPHPIAFSG
jgi:hypothetical protein